MKIGSTAIAEAVVYGVFPIPRHLCVANVSWSLLSYEADLIAVTASGYMIEVEIKISLSDLKRDSAKAKWRHREFDALVSRFYYAMPDSLWRKPAAQACVQDWAGVITVDAEGRATVVREATRRTARALKDSERFILARIGSFRAWSPAMKHRLRQLKAKHKLEQKKRDHHFQEWLEKRKAEQA